MAIWSQINTAVNPFSLAKQPPAAQQGHWTKASTSYSAKINQNICVALEGNGKTFGERPKPQEEVACRCSPIRENATEPARCQHQSRWAPLTERGSIGFRTIRHAPEAAAWKRFDAPPGTAGRHPLRLTQTAAADRVRQLLVGIW